MARKLVLHGRGKYGDLRADSCWFIGGFRVRSLLCDTLVVVGNIHLDRGYTRSTIVYGSGFINELKTSEALFIARSVLIIRIGVFSNGYLVGDKRPVVVNSLSSENLHAVNTLITRAKVKSSLVLLGRVFIRVLEGSPMIIFRDPYNRFEEIRGNPSYQYLYEG